jgi:hypothetical protein
MSTDSSLHEHGLFTVVAHTPFEARLPIELSFVKGARIVVIDATSRPSWYFGVKGRYGTAGW